MNNLRKSWLLAVCFLLLSLTCFAQTNRWTGIGPEGGAISALIQHPVQGNIMFAALQNKPSQLYRSTDGGLRWTKCREFESAVLCLKISSHKPNTLYAVSGATQMSILSGEKHEPGRLYQSKDEGKSWSIKNLPPIYAVTKIELDPRQPSTIHAVAQVSMNQGTVYLKSTDEGSTWMTTEVLPDRSWATMLTIDQRNPGVMYIGAYPMMMTQDTKILYRSTNGGKSFSAVTTKLNYVGPVDDIVLDPRNPGRIFFLNYAGVFRSTDDGATWQKNKGTLTTPQRLWIDPANSDHVLAAVYRGIAESHDAGVTFKSVVGTLPGNLISSFIVSSGKNSFALISNSAGIFRSTDLGKSWSPSHKGILGTQVTSLRLSAASPGTLMAGVINNAVYKTVASGAPSVSWEQLPVFYTCSSIGDIQVIPKKPYKILAIEGGG